MSAFIVAAKRTAFGTFGGALKGFTATDMASHASRGALAAVDVSPDAVDSVIFGNVAQTSTDAAYLARHAALSAGVPIETPALTLNRLCGSGFQSVVTAAQEIALSETQLALVGGSESMSQAPLSVWGQDVRFTNKLLGKDLKLQDTLWSALTDAYVKLPMGITAENLAEKYDISREECDAFAQRSQATWGEAKAAGVFDSQITPIELKGRKGPVVFDTDEHPRPDTTLDSLAKLPPVFKKGGTVTAGSASGICDGAAALLVASESAISAHGLKPMVRIAGYSVVGVPPEIMGIGPCPAIRNALDRAGKTLDDMDFVEINEAFAAQFLACQKELGLNPDITNASGGAIALGHPLGASGARITTHLANRLVDSSKSWAIGAACIGGGQGIAIVLERC